MYHFQHQDIVHRQAVFQTVHATGIFRDIAANGAGDLRRRIGRVIHAMHGCRFGDRQVAHPGLHGGHRVIRIDADDALEFGQAQQHAIRQRQCASGKTGARAARHHRHLLRMAQAHDALHLFDGLGQHHDHGQLPVHRQPVAFERAQVLRIDQHGFRRQ